MTKTFTRGKTRDAAGERSKSPGGRWCKRPSRCCRNERLDIDIRLKGKRTSGHPSQNTPTSRCTYAKRCSFGHSLRRINSLMSSRAIFGKYTHQSRRKACTTQEERLSKDEFVHRGVSSRYMQGLPSYVVVSDTTLGAVFLGHSPSMARFVNLTYLWYLCGMIQYTTFLSSRSASTGRRAVW